MWGSRHSCRWERGDKGGGREVRRCINFDCKLARGTGDGTIFRSADEKSRTRRNSELTLNSQGWPSTYHPLDATFFELYQLELRKYPLKNCEARAQVPLVEISDNLLWTDVLYEMIGLETAPCPVTQGAVSGGSDEGV
jgi:hypothetical protein